MTSKRITDSGWTVYTGAQTHTLPKTRVGGAVLMRATNPASTVPSSDVNLTVSAAVDQTAEQEDDSSQSRYATGRAWHYSPHTVWLTRILPCTERAPR
jgi:hypothetical protein